MSGARFGFGAGPAELGIPVHCGNAAPLPVGTCGRITAVNWYRVETAWGEAAVAASGDCIVGVHPPGDARVEGDSLAHAPSVVREIAARIAAAFEGDTAELVDRRTLERWLDAAGVTGFRRDVSLALFDVPHGVTVTYGELAMLAGRPGAARAAGSTCARNPLPIVVPCHRVLPAGGRLGRYGTLGAGYKRRLLQLEGVQLDAADRVMLAAR